MANDFTADAKVITRVWLARFSISLASTAVVAWGVSFWIADYVVKANNSMIATTFGGMQSTLEQLNASVQAQTEVLMTLSEQGASQGTEISYIRRDLGRVQAAVQDFGIRIPAVGSTTDGFVLNTAKFDELFRNYQTSGEKPIFLQIDPAAFIQKD